MNCSLVLQAKRGEKFLQNRISHFELLNLVLGENSEPKTSSPPALSSGFRSEEREMHALRSLIVSIDSGVCSATPKEMGKARCLISLWRYSPIEEKCPMPNA
jgi:hypothetical protein